MSPKSRSITLAGTLLLPACFAPQALVAQDAVVLPEVTVLGEAGRVGGVALDQPTWTGSRLGLKLRETPASVEIINREQLRERGDERAQEAVSRATGITWIGTPGNGSTSLSARGFAGHGSVMQLYDGTRMYVAAGTVTFPVDTWAFDRIEVLRGPASVLYGEGAIGAAVNYVPKKPNRTRIENEAFVSYGRWNSVSLGFGSGGPITDRVAYRVDLSHSQSNGWVDRGDSDRTVFAGQLAFQLTPDLSFSLLADVASSHDPRYWGTPRINGAIPENLRYSNFNVTDSVIRYDDTWLRGRFEWRTTPQVVLRNETYRLTSDRHWRNLENYTYQPATGLVRRTSYLETGHDIEQVGNRFDATIDGTIAGLKNRLVVGFDANRIIFKRPGRTTLNTPSDVNPFSFEPGTFNETNPYVGLRHQIETRQLALFAENALDLTARLKLVAGVRSERMDIHREDYVPPGPTFDKRFSPTTWRLGAVYALTPALSVYGQYATGVDPLGSLVTTTVEQAAFDLAKGRQIEIGLKQEILGGRGEWTAAFYDIEKRNLLSRDPLNPLVSQQVGQQSSRGVEFTVGVEFAPRWILDANLALLQARFDRFDEQVGAVTVSRAGNLPPNVPETTANAWLSHRFGSGWQAGVGMRYVGQRFANNANTISLPKYTVWDGYIGYNIARDTTLMVRLRNAFDKLYEVAPYNAGNQSILGEPRSVALSLYTRF
jgi:iron complex outermembrane receptor protein